MVQLPAFHARLLCPPKKDSIEVKEAAFVLILFSARFILGTLKITLDTILGTILCGFVRNMQAIIGTKSPQLRWLRLVSRTLSERSGMLFIFRCRSG